MISLILGAAFLATLIVAVVIALFRDDPRGSDSNDTAASSPPATSDSVDSEDLDEDYGDSENDEISASAVARLVRKGRVSASSSPPSSLGDDD